MKVAVTGSDGGLGSQLLKRCHKKGWKLLPLTRKDADLEKPDEVEKLLTEFRPSLILHTAAMTDVDRCEREPELAEAVNVLGTQAVVNSAKQTGAKVVYISTEFVFNGEKPEPYLESDEADPISVYGQSKLKGEKIVSLLPAHLIIRTSWLYGGGSKSFVKTMLSLGSKGEPVKVVDDQVGAPTYYPDLAGGIITLIDSDVGGTFNIVNAGCCSRFESAVEIFQQKDFDTPLEPVPSSAFKSDAKRPLNSRLNCTKFIKVAGKPLRHWKSALKEYLNV